MEWTISVTNRQEVEVRVVLEPWLDERRLTPGSTATISLSGPPVGPIEIETRPQEIVVYGWAGSLLQFR